MRFVVLLIALTTSNLCTANEDQLVSKTIDSLVNMLSDSYSSEFERNVYELEKNYMKAVFFTIEGFGGGNNWQRYLAIFQKSVKVNPEPPFEPIGEAKYRLLGYLVVAKDHTNSVDEEAFLYKSGKLKIPSISLRHSNRNKKLNDIVINIKAHSLEVVSGIN